MSSFRRVFASSEKKQQRIRYHRKLPKWELLEETYTLADVEWFCNFIRKSKLSSELEEHFLALCSEVDVSEANVHVGDVFQDSDAKGLGKLAREQGRRTLLQELMQPEGSSRVFKRPGEEMWRWTMYDPKPFKDLYERGSPQHREVACAIVARWNTPHGVLDLEKTPATARRLASQVLVQILQSPGADESSSHWFVDMFTGCALRLQEIWWLIWATQ